MEEIKILGVDPSLRHTGLAVVSYNTETHEKKVSHCHVLDNPKKYKGTEAILNMLDMIKEISILEEYINVDAVIVESPPMMFSQHNWSSYTVALLAHISGGAIALLGLEKGYLFKPIEWNRRKKKEVTHKMTMEDLGHYDNWHYKKKVKNQASMEHILDAASMAWWWLKSNYIDE